MKGRRRVAGWVFLGAGVLLAVLFLSAAAFQLQQGSALDIQATGMLRYNGYLWIAVSDASGPVTRLQRGNVHVESLMYPLRSEPGDREGDIYRPEMAEFEHLSDGVYEIRLVPIGGVDRWDTLFDYIVKVSVESPVGSGIVLCKFRWTDGVNR